MRADEALDFGFGRGSVLDVSDAGVRLLSFVPLEPGQWLRIHPHGSGSGIRVQVVWTRPEGVTADPAFGESAVSSLAGCHFERPADARGVYGRYSGDDSLSQTVAYWVILGIIAGGGGFLWACFL